MKKQSILAVSIGLVASLVLGGCCSQYKDKIANQDRAIDGLESTRSDLDSKIASLNEDRSKFRDRVGELEGKNESLVEYQAALEQELTKLGGDKETMKQQYDAALESQKVMIARMREKQARAQARLETLRDMLAKFKNLIEGGKLNVRIRDGKLMLDLPSAVLFPLGKASISEDGMLTLGEVATVLSQIEGREFQVAGHTDDLPLKSGSPFDDNWELSTARSLAVVRALEEMGVDPKTLSASGYSMHQPLVPNTDKDKRALNRRIEVVLMPNLDELPDTSELEQEIE